MGVKVQSRAFSQVIWDLVKEGGEIVEAARGLLVNGERWRNSESSRERKPNGKLTNPEGVNQMADSQIKPLVWVRDNADNLFLCPYDKLKDPNRLSEEEKQGCLHDASDLLSRDSVPSNKPEGKIKFTKSASAN